MIRYASFNPPLGWTGRINRQSRQYAGLLAWWALRSEAYGASVVNLMGNGTDQFPGGSRNPSWQISNTVGISLAGNSTAYNDANGDHVPVTSISAGTVHSISFWCRYENYPTLAYGGIPLGGSSTSYVDWINGSSRRYAVGGVSVDITSTLTKGGWNHHAWTRNGTTVTAYLNGRQDGSPGTLGANNALTIAYLMSNGQYFLNGNIADVRIYNRTLSAAEIWRLYDLQTRWELYQMRPMVWWVAQSGAQTYYQTLLAEIEPSTEPDGATPNAPIKRTSRTLAGALTPAAALTSLAALFRTLTAGLTPAGNLVRRTARTLTANSTEPFPRALLFRHTARTLAAALTPAAALSYLKAIFRTLTAGLTPAGGLVKLPGKFLTAGIAPAVSLVKRTSRTLAGALTPAAALSYLKAFFRTLTAGLTPAGNLIKLPSKFLAAGVTPAVSLVKRTSRTLAATLAPAAELGTLRAFLRTLTASLTPTATLSTLRAFVRTLTAGLTPDGSLVRRTERTLLAGLMPVGSVIRFLVGALSGRARCTLTIEAATVAGLSMVNATRCRLEMSEV